MKNRKVFMTSVLLAAAAFAFAGCHKEEEKTQTETALAGTIDKEQESPEADPKPTGDAESEQAESTVEGNTPVEEEESGYLLAEFIAQYYKKGYVFPEKAIPEGDCITFGKYEQDGNLENGPEPVEWIILDSVDWESDYIPVISKSVLDVLPINNNQINYRGFLGNPQNSFQIGYPLSIPFCYSYPELTENRVRLPIQFGDDERGFVGEGSMLPLRDDGYLIPQDRIRCTMTPYAIKRNAEITGTSDEYANWVALGLDRISIDELAEMYIDGVERSMYINREGRQVIKSQQEKSVGFRPLIWISRDYFLAKYLNVDFSMKDMKRELRSFQKGSFELTNNNGFTHQMMDGIPYQVDLDGNGTDEIVMIGNGNDGASLWLLDDDSLFFLVPRNLKLEYFGTISLVDFDTEDGKIDICISGTERSMAGYKYVYRYDGSKLSNLCSFELTGAFPKLILNGDSSFKVQTILQSSLVDQLGTLSMQINMKISKDGVVSLDPVENEDSVATLILPKEAEDKYFYPRAGRDLIKIREDGSWYVIEADPEKQYIPVNITYSYNSFDENVTQPLVYVETGGNEENDSGYLQLPVDDYWLMVDSIAVEQNDWSDEFTSYWFSRVPKIGDYLSD